MVDATIVEPTIRLYFHLPQSDAMSIVIVLVLALLILRFILKFTPFIG